MCIRDRIWKVKEFFKEFYLKQSNHKILVENLSSDKESYPKTIDNKIKVRKSADDQAIASAIL